MKRYRQIHWLAPASMVGALIAGLLFATGHHLYYESLDGRIVGRTSYSVLGSSISQQQTSIAIGTAFAFLTKACLVYAVLVAYSQVFWREANRPNTAPTLAVLDDISSAADNVLVLFKFPLWLKYPLLLLIGTAAWIIPVASIITPATLSTRIAPVVPTPIRQHDTPQLDFRSLSFVDTMKRVGSDGATVDRYSYQGPSRAVTIAVDTVMANGAILPIVPPAPNSSWTLDFYGPSIACNPANETIHTQVRQNIAHYLNSSFYVADPYNYSNTSPHNNEFYPYLSWFPTSDVFDDSLPDIVPLDPQLPPPNYPEANGSVSIKSGQLSKTIFTFVASEAM